MSPIETAAILSGRPTQPMATAAIDDAELASMGLLENTRQAWNTVIDSYLLEWGNAPISTDEEDFISPFAEAVERACQIALRFRDNGMASPLRVLPDGEGGISFERRDATRTEIIAIHANGSAEFLVFDDCRLIDRGPLS